MERRKKSEKVDLIHMKTFDKFPELKNQNPPIGATSELLALSALADMESRKKSESGLIRHEDYRIPLTAEMKKILGMRG